MIIYYTDKYENSRGESHELLRKALAVHTGDEKLAESLTGALKKGEHGKPYIDGFSCFSISHTGNFWAVLIAEHECGLDIQLGRKSDFRAIAERWFAPVDAASIAEAAKQDSDSAYDEFFRLWARREALTKAVGGTVYDPGLPAVQHEHAEAEGKTYTITDIRLPGNVQIYAAVCVEGTASESVPEYRYL